MPDSPAIQRPGSIMLAVLARLRAGDGMTRRDIARNLAMRGHDTTNVYRAIRYCIDRGLVTQQDPAKGGPCTLTETGRTLIDRHFPE